jgi:RND family efflux transporter MFP subunit
LQRRVYLEAKAAYDEARAALADTSLKAPFTGVVARTMVENHQEVKDKEPVISLQDISNLEIEVQVPERDMILGRSFESVELFVSLDALPGRQFAARYQEQTTQADPSTQTFSITVVMPKPKGVNILPGMTAEVRALFYRAKDERSAAIRVPVEAVLADESKRSSVWVIDPKTNKVWLAPVELGPLSQGRVAITKGLTPGVNIVVAGVHHLRNGMKVRILKQASGQPGQ